MPNQISTLLQILIVTACRACIINREREQREQCEVMQTLCGMSISYIRIVKRKEQLYATDRSWS